MRIAIWCELNFAMGRVHSNLAKRLRADGHEVDIYDWSNRNGDTARLLARLLTYDRIVSTSLITSCHLFDMNSVHVRQRLIAVAHSSTNNEHFRDKFEGVSRSTPVACAGAVSLDGLEFFSSQTTQPLTYLPCGVDLIDFPLCRTYDEASTIRRIGFIGNSRGSPAYNEIKRPEWAVAIAKQANCELVFLYGNKVEDARVLYKDVDLLVCTSLSESGPLGIFEAAALGIPVISTRVGNVALLTTMEFFNTIDEGAHLVQALASSPALLARYTAAVSAEVRDRFSWDVLYAKHWQPLFVGPAGSDLNFVEIGTSDFDTCCQSSGEDVAGICVEPVKLYLEKLPDKSGVLKVHGAVSDTDGTMQVYYVRPEVIELFALPAWCRGCNKVSEPHPLVVAELVKAGVADPLTHFTVDTVPVFSFATLMAKCNVRSIDMLKVDTEGHDCTIMSSVLTACMTRRELFPRKIIFETNEHSTKEQVDSTIANFEAHGYIAQRGYDTVLRRLW